MPDASLNLGPSRTGNAHAPAPAAERVGRIARAKLGEPVRLYLWPVALLLLVSGTAGGFRDGDWWRASLFIAAAVLVLLMTEAVRASTFSAREMVDTLRRAGGRW